MGKMVVKIKDSNVKDLVQCWTQSKCSINFSYYFQDHHLRHYLFTPHPLTTTTTITSPQGTYRLLEEVDQCAVKHKFIMVSSIMAICTKYFFNY